MCQLVNRFDAVRIVESTFEVNEFEIWRQLLCVSSSTSSEYLLKLRDLLALKRMLD